jgi:hypothetical protein
MATITKLEESMDLQKVRMQTITQQAFEDIDANDGARAWRKETTDGVTTMVEEFLLDQGQPAYSADGTVSSEPLETHSLFSLVGPWAANAWATWKRNPNADSLSKANTGSEGNFWTPEVDGIKDSHFAVFYGLYKMGIESYLAPRVIVRMTELEDGPPDVANVGKIDNGANSSGVTLASGNWLLSSVHGQQEGTMWRNTYEWMGSNQAAAAGWNATIYGTGNG